MAVRGVCAFAACLGVRPCLGGELPYGFDELCTPGFASSSWASRRTTLLEPGRDISQLFGLADLAQLLSDEEVVIAGGRSAGTTSVSPQPFKKKGAVIDFFRGATLSLSAIELKVPSLATWSRAFARAFGVNCEVNLYLTPGSSQAFSVHNDRQDVLAAQVFGKKEWRAWDLDGLELSDDILLFPVASPFKHTVSLLDSASVPLGAFPTPSLEPKLRPGQLLYVPRGSLHVASTAGGEEPSLHLTIGVLSQTFSLAFAVFYAAAEPEVLKVVEGSGWSLHKFRQALMKLADHKENGVDFRRSLPLGWVWAQAARESSGPDCGAGALDSLATESLLSTTRSTIEELLLRVLQGALLPPESLPPMSSQAMQSVASVFARNLDEFDADLLNTSSAPQRQAADSLLLPAGLVVSHDAGGELDDITARFSWCDGQAEPVEVQWPSVLLPMLTVVAASASRSVSLSELSGGGDAVSQMIFAAALARLPVEPPIQLVVLDSLSTSSLQRSPVCGDAEASAEL